ncbi:MAG: T9SS type A sorting domain-containing protein, partial [Ignavibacteriae bacterium]|nr:T9SS type A sorting domain-containing protein [Ignavibacteriota bacterium]
SGTVLSANILTFNTSGFYRFNPGTYLLGTVRWTATAPVTNCNMTFRMPPAASPTLITDSTVFLDTAGFTITNPVITGNFTVSSEIPTEFKLYENYPNPFNPSTSIQYDIPANSFVKLIVYDITGKEVTTLINETMPAGKYEAVWNGKEFASGVYFARLEAGSYKHIIKMLMVK